MLEAEQVGEMPSKQKRFHFQDHIYQTDWHLAVGGDAQKAATWWTTYWELPHFETSNGRSNGKFISHTHIKGGLFWFPFKPSHRTIVHETMHGTARLFSEFLGVKLKTHTEEVYAYYQDWLFREICKRLKIKV